MSLMPKAAIEKVASNDPSFTRLEFKDSSVWQMKSDEYTSLLADALTKNTTLKELTLDKCLVTDMGCVALSFALRTQVGLEKLQLPNNKIGSVGLTAIAEMLQTNDTIVELNLFGNQRFGDPSVMALVDALERANTALSKIVWRMDNTKGLSWKLTKLLSRNVEIGRRRVLGNSYDDLDPRKNGAALSSSQPSSGSSSPNIERRSMESPTPSPAASPQPGATPRSRMARHTVSVSSGSQKELLGMLNEDTPPASPTAKNSWTPSRPSGMSGGSSTSLTSSGSDRALPVPNVSTTAPDEKDDLPLEPKKVEEAPAKKEEEAPPQEADAAPAASAEVAPAAGDRKVTVNGKSYELNEKQAKAMSELKEKLGDKFCEVQAVILEAFC